MNSLVVILLGLFLAHLRHVNAEIKVLKKSIVDHDKNLVYPYHTYVDEHLSYALCDNDREAQQVKCTLMREKTPYGNDTYSCDVIVKSHSDTGHMPSINIFSFENYVAINVFEPHHEETYMNFTTVQWKNCKVGEAVIDTKMPLSLPFADFVIVGHDDSYDVILRSDNLVTYANKSKKITIGADGHVIDGPNPSAISLSASDIIHRSVVPLNEGSSGYFQIQTDDDEEYIQVLIKPDGTEKVLAAYPKPLSPLYLSIKNNLLSACYQTNSEYNCTQYDYEGKLKLQITKPRSLELDGIRLFGSYNLPNGGLYLLNGQCPNGRGDCKRTDLQFSIERIDANGARTGSMKFQGEIMNYEDETSWLFYENENKDTCISLLVPNTDNDGKDRLDLIANCFTDADFSM